MFKSCTWLVATVLNSFSLYFIKYMHVSKNTHIYCACIFLSFIKVVIQIMDLKISVQFSRSVMSYSLRPHGLQQARLSCPSPTPGAYSSSCPLSQWCHPTISSSVVAFSSCLSSFPTSGCFPMSQFFTSGGQSIGVSASASVLPMNIQD